MISGYAKRFWATPAAGPRPYRLDMFGLDSDFDYDPLWATCVELGVAPVVHSALQQHRVTRSISNYVYNHVNGLAAAHESLCKSLFLGGRHPAVPRAARRVPRRRRGLGVQRCSPVWSATGRSATATPSSSSIPIVSTSTRCWATSPSTATTTVLARLGELRDYFGRPAARPAQLDEFAARRHRAASTTCATRFEPNFYFGCEADDPLVAWAFRDDVNPLGARLRPVLGSDISHWDVPRHDRTGGRGVRAGGARGDHRARLPRPHVREPGAAPRGPNPTSSPGTVCEAAVGGVGRAR